MVIMLKALYIVALMVNIILQTESASESAGNSHHKCRVNEIFVECPDAVCVPKTCEDVGYPVPCIDLGPDGKCPSKPDCICKEGYVRNSQGICIPMKNCRSCGGDKNARSGCGVNCGMRCSDYFGQTRPCPKICNVNGCDCKPGYYYDENTNECVSPEQCTPQCPVNEKYESCPVALCRPQHCSQLGYPIICPAITEDYPCPGEPACICDDGYVRDYDGTCIPIKQCPSCGGDRNAESGCGFECGKHCMDLYNDEPRPCIVICRLNGCQCKPGKYYDEITKKCVDPSCCTEVCRENEVLSECINGGCDRRNCSQLDQPKICINPYTCERGCICRDGYLRHPNRSCVPIKKCPPVCGVDEVYNACLESVCEATTCKQLGYPFGCIAAVPTTCTEGCLCKEGYLRADNGTCIPAKTCPSCGGDINAEAGCGIYCNKRCSDIGNKPRTCDEMCNANTCDCKEGLYLDDNSGKCVPPENCSCLYTNGCVSFENGTCILTSQCPSTITTSNSSTSPIDTDVGLANFRKGNIALTGEFVYLLNKSEPGVSFVLSAVSVLIPYAQLALYAYGLVLEQLLKATNLDSKDEIRTIVPIAIKKYQDPTTAAFEIGIKFYANWNYLFTETFKREAIDFFTSEGENLDFSQNDKAAQTINNWVNNKTNGNINNLVDSNMFSGDTRVVLVNAIYFWDNWKHQFNPNDTENRDFYLTPNNTKSIPTMYQQYSFNYYESEDIDAQILQIPYKDDNFSFVLWLPRQKDGLTLMVEKLRNPETVIESLSSFTSETVKVYLPIIKINSKLDIKDLSIQANITEMFNSSSDGFKGIFVDDSPLYISSVVQQIEVMVTETGTEAAAATAVTVTTTSAVYPPPEITIVNANHPFAYSVMFQDEPLFAGVYAGD